VSLCPRERSSSLRPPRQNGDEEPTQKQVERRQLVGDVKKLLHGKADGRIVIENESPRQLVGDDDGGVHEVIDDMHSGRSAFIGKASLAAATVEGSKEE